MAFSLDSLKAKILTSIHGRRLGLDDGEFLVGPKGLRKPITDATSDTTGTALPNHGVVSVVTTTDDSWTLTAPVPGCEVSLFTGSSSTGIHTVNFTNATAVTTNGVASSAATLSGGGACLALLGISTSQWALKSKIDSSVTSSAGTGPTVNFTS